MFQYATGRALSLTLGCPLLLDLRGFERYVLHNGFEINRVFYAPVQAATEADVSQVLGWRASELIRKLFKKVHSPLLHGSGLIIEPHFNYWPKLRDIDRPSYLMGYWQSEKYFEDFEQIIRTDFSFKEELNGENLETCGRMQDCNSVSLHVRRGDYVTNALTSKVLTVCPIDYYRNAIMYIAERVASPRFFVFSDDMNWVRDNLKIPFPAEYIDRNRGTRSYIDMQLMSLCGHQIIANSSFSWWGAWLNQRPGKVIVAPRNWFCNGINDCDLTPKHWTRI
jgi:hypothetical protein